MAQITDLPVEVFNLIFEQFQVMLDDLFPIHLRRLRLVCRALDAMIVQFALRLPERFERCWQVDAFYFNLDFRERCLFEIVVMRDGNRQSVEDRYKAAIFQVSDFILGLANESQGSIHTDRLRYLRALCKAVTWRVSWRRVQPAFDEFGIGRGDRESDSDSNSDTGINGQGNPRTTSRPGLKGAELLNAALVAAVCDGNMPLFQLLLHKGADINAQSRIFGNPLRIAVICRNPEITGILLRNKSRVLHVDTYTQMTLLHWAAQEGQTSIVQELLDQEDVDADPRNRAQQTPLLLAAKYGHTDTVKLLAGREDVNPNQVDSTCGRTPLSFAAMHCDETMAAVLMSQAEVDVNARNNLEETPLLCAVKSSRYLGLLEADIPVKYKDGSGKWQESTAAAIRSTPIVELFLSHDGVDFLAPHRYGDTPLMRMEFCGMMNPLHRLLERKTFNPKVCDSRGRDVLAQAAARGCLQLATLLVDRDDTDPDSKDVENLTPLSHAASGGHADVVKLLLSRNDVNAESRDNDGRTPLSYAASCPWDEISHTASSPCIDVTRLLADHENVNADGRDNLGRTPLAWAARRGVAEFLANRIDVNADSRDSEGLSPLWHALQAGRLGVVEVLASREDVDIESEGPDGRTPAEYVEEEEHDDELAAFIRAKVTERQS